MDFLVGCWCSTCDLATLASDYDHQNVRDMWTRWWWRLIAFRLWRRQVNDAVVCRWQLAQLSAANGGESPRALAAKLDAEGGPGPTRLTVPSLFGSPDV